LSKTSANLMGMMNEMMSNTKPTNGVTEESVPKRKMQGPDINIDDL
jgi:hypothetical protein